MVKRKKRQFIGPIAKLVRGRHAEYRLKWRAGSQRSEHGRGHDRESLMGLRDGVLVVPLLGLKLLKIASRYEHHPIKDHLRPLKACVLSGKTTHPSLLMGPKIMHKL